MNKTLLGAATWLVATSLPAAQARADGSRAGRLCSGWAAVGAVGGAFAGTAGIFGAMTAAGGDIDDPRHASRNTLLVLAGMHLGMSLGPIATCRIFDDEPHSVPAATFILGGASAGGALAGALLFPLLAQARGADATNASHGEGLAALGLTGVVLAAVAGGVGGYYLHQAAYATPVRAAALAPAITRDRVGFVAVATF